MIGCLIQPIVLPLLCHSGMAIEVDNYNMRHVPASRWREEELSAAGLYTECTTTPGSSTVMNSTLSYSQTVMLLIFRSSLTKNEFPCFFCGRSAMCPKEYLKRNVQYQLLELMSRFDEELLQRAETFNMKSFILKHISSISMRLTVYRKIVMFVHWYKY